MQWLICDSALSDLQVSTTFTSTLLPQDGEQKCIRVVDSTITQSMSGANVPFSVVPLSLPETSYCISSSKTYCDENTTHRQGVAIPPSPFALVDQNPTDGPCDTMEEEFRSRHASPVSAPTLVSPIEAASPESTIRESPLQPLQRQVTECVTPFTPEIDHRVASYHWEYSLSKPRHEQASTAKTVTPVDVRSHSFSRLRQEAYTMIQLKIKQHMQQQK